jgi:Na+-transporting methylmalonyl-CoA/oxaloacetate decarboxylase gamma subunit
MKSRKLRTIGMAVVMTVLLSLAGGIACAADSAPMTPEYAAKKENHRKQQEQRITTDKRKAAAENLKAERLKVYKAKQAVKHSKPATIENK